MVCTMQALATDPSPSGGHAMSTGGSINVDMDSAADKALRIVDKIIYGEKVGRMQCP